MFAPVFPRLAPWALIWYEPGTSFTDQTGDIIYTFETWHNERRPSSGGIGAVSVMPWKESCAMEERARFVFEVEQDESTMAELCRRYAITRPTGYKWWQRYQQGGVKGLEELGRAPRNHRNAMSGELEEAVLDVRRAHSRWGPRKVRAWLAEKQPGQRWPAASTIGALLKREGLTVARKPRRKTPPQTQPLFEAAFREHGMPQAMRTDKGAPFASRALGGLSKLSIWWIKLGIMPERIAPGHPEQIGRHERLHRTLKAETASPPETDRRAQQRPFDRFLEEYNGERPHEAIGLRPPASVYVPSPLIYTGRLPEIEYATGVVVR
jgi:transposase-like protein